MLSLLRLERKQKNYSNPFRIRIFLFLSYSFGIETINTFIHSVVPSKTISDSRPKWAKCIPVSDQNGAKTLPDGAAHTYMAYIREYPPPGILPVVWGPFNSSRVGISSITQIKKCKFEKNASTPSKRARTAFEMKTFHWGRLKKNRVL